MDWSGRLTAFEIRTRQGDGNSAVDLLAMGGRELLFDLSATPHRGDLAHSSPAPWDETTSNLQSGTRTPRTSVQVHPWLSCNGWRPFSNGDVHPLGCCWCCWYRFSPGGACALGPVREVAPHRHRRAAGRWGGITATNVTSVTVPANHTVIDAGLTVGTVWSEDGSNGTQFAHDTRTGFSGGLHDRTEGLLRGGRLTLASPASNNDVEDFEDPC